jgi:hypothetical protein
MVLAKAVLVVALGANPSMEVLRDWTGNALENASAAKQPAFVQARTLAMVHVAMFEAINAVEKRFVPYKVAAVATPGTSADAAAAVAAHDVLAALFPSEAASFDAKLDIAMVRINDPGVRSSSVALGQRVAAAILALRAADGSDAPNTWRPVTSPGVYIPTTLPLGTSWAKVTPWVLDKADQFHPAPPPPLTSAEWARDYNEVKTLGSKASTVRTALQTETALFWVVTGPPHFVGAALSLMGNAQGRSLVQNARLLALLSMVLADGYVAIFEAKYAYNLWRPITAIRDGDLDGNDATAADFGWLPLIDTPMHPEYPCAHCINAGAAGVVLEREFGSGRVPKFQVTGPGTPSVTHTWERIADFVDEVSNARVWAGVHYRNSTAVGAAMGRKLGELACDKLLRPVK